ncbi:MAG: hypothetical protein A3E87_09045 [Gammaproteobacteria bacterium RIFCSPHIGHO2_12_FULL_35_23]|nr:MAG: hypothetical protein A3E87_09045 [Gammaproteobacteria bacterium RIFCSPHIGHO2_12_FULL_35_23]
MLTNIKITQIKTAETYPIRQVILRPGRSLSTCYFAGDEEKYTFHFGAFDSQILVGICSIYKKAPLSQTGSQYWQIRGMAVLSHYQGKNVGTKLLNHAMQFIITAYEKKPAFWCNARIAAVNLYLRSGFQIIDEQFEIPDVGPHYLMIKTNLSPPDALLPE